MRLLMAALLAAIVSLGGILLFAKYFGSIETVSNEESSTVAERRRSDTETKSGYPCYENQIDCDLSSRFGGLVSCYDHGIVNYFPPMIIARIHPSWPADAPNDTPKHTVTANYCISVEGRAFEISASGKPTPRFTRVTERVIAKWIFEPARSASEPIQVCQCQSVLTYEFDN